MRRLLCALAAIELACAASTPPLDLEPGPLTLQDVEVKNHTQKLMDMLVVLKARALLHCPLLYPSVTTL